MDAALPDPRSLQPGYGDRLAGLRALFPQPFPAPLVDSAILAEFAQALQQIEHRRSTGQVLGGPVLGGHPREGDSASSQLDVEGLTPEHVVAELADCLAGMPLWQHPHSLGNVHQQPLIIGLLPALLAGLFNPNLCSEEAGPGFAEAERRAIAMTAELVGFNPARAGGVFTFGGTGFCSTV